VGFEEQKTGDNLLKVRYCCLFEEGNRGKGVGIVLVVGLSKNLEPM
jgi:hypothetical protein